MQATIQYIQDHWQTISACLAFVISEFMELNPNSQYGGILSAIKGMLSKKEDPKP